MYDGATFKSTQVLIHPWLLITVNSNRAVLHIVCVTDLHIIYVTGLHTT